ncbi:SAM-dependent methyltransferase [bacterium]|nr:SAM-dependent methyltransferase [bacterium]
MTSGPHNTEQQFADQVAASVADGSFVRLVLSNPAGGDTQKVLGRLVELKAGPCLSLTYRQATRDLTRNLPTAEVAAWLRDELGGSFRSALLGTTKRDWQYRQGARRLTSHRPVATEPPARAHDHPRQSVLGAAARDWLHGLGIKETGAKYRQIDRYAEIFSHLAKDCGWLDRREDRLTIADMGCGKGYLTFAVWQLCARVWERPVRVIGVEQRAELVAAANRLARRIKATGLEFVTGTIATTSLPVLDGLIALHACDTATDDAIRRGIAAGARLIVVAPCCHKQVRPQLGQPEPLAPVLAHGLMAERLAEWATDGLRALALEAAGYQVKMIEFVATEHTPKNLMIAAVRTGPSSSTASVDRFKSFFGINHQALDGLGRS